jgi:hypothetical protein
LSSAVAYIHTENQFYCQLNHIQHHQDVLSFISNKIVEMKNILIITLIYCCEYANSQSLLENDSLKCSILEKIFSEQMFYISPSLNLTYADTITVLDKSFFWHKCDVNTIIVDTINTMKKTRIYEGKPIVANEKKTILVIHSDIIPFPLINGTSLLNKKERYDSYFIIDNVEVIGKIAIIRFFKLVSNHSGFLIYKISGNDIILIDSQLGQY